MIDYPSLTLVVTCLLLLAVNSCANSLDFDPEIWKTWVEREDNAFVRHRMAKGLIESERLIGSTPAEVKVLLGTPGHNHHGIWEYNTGPCESQLLGIDYSVLEVHFSKGIVESVELDCH